MADLFRSKEDHFPIEANRLSSENAEVLALWCGGISVTEHDALQHDVTFSAINVPTVLGMKRAQEGDWIIKLPKGDFCPVKPDKFEHLFEAVVDG